LHKIIICTTTFSFAHYLTFPQYKPPISFLKQGPNGIFGICMSTTSESENLDHYAIPCFFLRIDLNIGEVVEYTTIFPYRNLDTLNVRYDALNKVWVVVPNALIWEEQDLHHRTVLDLYEIPSETHKPWLRLLRLEEPYNESNYLITFWQDEISSPLVFAEQRGDDGLSDRRLYWTQWRSSILTKSVERHLFGKCFFVVPYRFDETLLLFTGEYQRRSGHWRFRIGTYDNHGTRLSSKLVPHVSFPNRHTGYYIASDLWDWLWPTIHIIQGPSFGTERRPTCVAVLLFKEQLELSPAWNKGRLPKIEHGLPPVQGGLYWIDTHGHILQHESSLLGEQISLCRCGETIVGTDLSEGQRWLWSWSPLDGSERVIKMTLSIDTERVTLISMEQKQKETATSFWCIEEYAQGIRVSLWDAETYREMQYEWLPELGLCDHLSGPGNYREPCAVGYQDTLLIVGITPERRFQILQFRRSD
jgi:hypothetical protein